jgi:hypothetical protein
MKYYILDNKAEPIFPQIGCINQNEAFKINDEKKLDYAPKLNFKLEKRAKATDILSQAEISALGLIINEKVKNIFNQFQLIEHQLFPITLQNTNDTYYWFHPIADLEKIDWIDYSQSTFYRSEFGFHEEDLLFESYSEYLKKNKAINDMSTISIEKIKLNENFNSKEYDLFILPFLSRDIFISENLKIELEKINISGIEIKEALIS